MVVRRFGGVINSSGERDKKWVDFEGAYISPTGISQTFSESKRSGISYLRGLLYKGCQFCMDYKLFKSTNYITPWKVSHRILLAPAHRTLLNK